MSHIHNIIVLGNRGVGKSSFLTRHITGDFSTDHQLTPNGTPYTINWTDHCFKITEQSVYQNQSEDGVIIMFDVTNRASYDSVPEYYEQVIQSGMIGPIILCGNKCDEREETWVVTHDEFADYSHEHGLRSYNTSAKSNYNYEKPFLWMVRNVNPDYIMNG
jgi:GTP-binding nuclear protein Ran